MESKKWWSSKTIWGVLIAFLGFMLTEKLQVPDIQLPENADFEQLKAYADAIKEAEGNLGVIAGQLLSAFGTLLAIIGRVKAETKIA
jgi:hypothetical protein